MSKRNRPRARTEYKICPNCKTRKPIKEFHRQMGESKRIVINCWCKGCHRDYSKEYRQQEGYREKNAAYMREYRRGKREKKVLH